MTKKNIFLRSDFYFFAKKKSLAYFTCKKGKKRLFRYPKMLYKNR